MCLTDAPLSILILLLLEAPFYPGEFSWNTHEHPDLLPNTAQVNKSFSSKRDSLIPSLFIAVISWVGFDSVAIKCAVAIIYHLITLAIDTWLERCDVWGGATTVNCLPTWGLNAIMTWRSLTVFTIWLVFPYNRSGGFLFWPLWIEESNTCISITIYSHERDELRSQNGAEAKSLRMVSHGSRWASCAQIQSTQLLTRTVWLRKRAIFFKSYFSLCT